MKNETVVWGVSRLQDITKRKLGYKLQMNWMGRTTDKNNQGIFKQFYRWSQEKESLQQI